MQDFLNLEIPEPKFNSTLTEQIIELEAMRTKSIGIEIYPKLFIQLTEIFHMLESLQSARIEGNRTTISDYVDTKFNSQNNKKEDTKEIENIEKTIGYINECFYKEKDFKISSKFIKELHIIITKGLKQEGSKTPGKYRSGNVAIKNAQHTPPNPLIVPKYMQELIDWINKEDKVHMQLLKVPIAHHAFTWIHPFDNGNGRMSRVLTYAMLMQYGFEMISLINTSAIFCIDRDRYFDMLQLADSGKNSSRLKWCEYVINGLKQEMSKIDKLRTKTFLVSNIILPALKKALEYNYITEEQKKILEFALNKQDGLIKTADVYELFAKKTKRQVLFIMKKLLEDGLIERTQTRSRKYFVNIQNKVIARGVIDCLYKEKLINIKD